MSESHWMGTMNKMASMNQYDALNQALKWLCEPKSTPKKHCPECIPSYGVNCSCCNCEGEK